MPFELQGHRGARGLAPENTLPAFEAAFDAGVSSVETDVHLTRNGAVVLTHDPVVSEGLYELTAGARDPNERRVRCLGLDELRRFRVMSQPDRFSAQRVDILPAARLFCRQRDLDPFAVPTLQDLFDFAAAYSAHRRKRRQDRPAAPAPRASDLRFGAEAPVPFEPELIGDDFNGQGPGLLEARVRACIQAAAMTPRCVVRELRSSQRQGHPGAGTNPANGDPGRRHGPGPARPSGSSRRRVDLLPRLSLRGQDAYRQRPCRWRTRAALDGERRGSVGVAGGMGCRTA